MWLACGILMASVSWICFGSVTDHLLDTHDDLTFRDNVAISADFRYFFSTEKEHPSGRPVAELVKWLAYTVWGNDPFWFHLLVIAAHTGASFLLARTARLLGASLETSVAGGLLFLVNVAHFQAVHHISALDYPLALIGGLAAVICYARFLQERQALQLALCYVALVGACLAHFSSAVVWFFCLYWAQHRGFALKAGLRHLLPLGLLLSAALALVLSITTEEASTWRSIDLYEEGGFFPVVAGQAQVLLWFLSRLLTTAHGLFIPVYDLQTWELFPGAVVLAGLAVLIWKRGTPSAAWSLWVLLSLLPFVLLTRETIVDLPAGPSRYLYPASAGSSLLFAMGLRRLSARFMPRYLFAACLAALLVSSYAALQKAEALSLYTSGRYYIAAGDFETGADRMQLAIASGKEVIHLEDTYLRLIHVLLSTEENVSPTVNEALERFPDQWRFELYRLALDSMGPDPELQRRSLEILHSYKGPPEAIPFLASIFGNIGLGLHGRKDLRGSAVTFRRSLEIKFREKTRDHLSEALFDLGNIHLDEGRFTAAAAVFSESLELNPQAPQVYATLGVALRSSGQLDEAAHVYEEAIQRFEMPVFYHNLGGVKLDQGDVEGAMAAYEKAVGLEFDNVYSYLVLSRLYHDSNRPDKWLQLYRRILDLDLSGASSDIYAQMGSTLRQLGHHDEAINAYRKALETNSLNHAARTGLGLSLTATGALDAAIEAYVLVLKDNRDVHAQFGLGMAYLVQGKIAQARAAYALGMDQFGAAGAQEALAIESLMSLISQGIRVTDANEVLHLIKSRTG